MSPVLAWSQLVLSRTADLGSRSIPQAGMRLRDSALLLQIRLVLSRLRRSGGSHDTGICDSRGGPAGHCVGRRRHQLLVHGRAVRRRDAVHHRGPANPERPVHGGERRRILREPELGPELGVHRRVRVAPECGRVPRTSPGPPPGSGRRRIRRRRGNLPQHGWRRDLGKSPLCRLHDSVRMRLCRPPGATERHLCRFQGILRHPGKR